MVLSTIKTHQKDQYRAGKEMRSTVSFNKAKRNTVKDQETGFLGILDPSPNSRF
jgi:hypothetical protein